MKKLLFFVSIAVIFFGLGLLLSCSSGGGGGARGGDDAFGDDDEIPIDDDVTDDDDGSDDDSGDDATDDDASGNLTWQDPPSSDLMTWDEAKAYCDNLSFDGHDDWHLPTISELRSLIRGCDATVTGGACGVTDDCLDAICWNHACGGCDRLAGPGSGGAYWPDGMSGEIDWYWSSSPVADWDYSAWYVDFLGGWLVNYYVDIGTYARCVRP